MRTKVISCVICALMVVTILMVEVPKDVSAQVTEEWVRRYNGPGNGLDIAHDIIVGPYGNIYVLGDSRGYGTGIDYVVIKYDSDGNELWVARYNSPGNMDDMCTDMVVDSLGNVFITGRTGEEYSNHKDYTTVAYDSDGTLLWATSYDGPANSLDEAWAITVDSLGKVYVTGFSSGENPYCYDIATIAYDSLGNQLWVTRSWLANEAEFAYDIVVDISGNVYVTGGVQGVTPYVDYDYLTIAYNSNGNQLWTKRYNGPGDGFDQAWDIDVDLQGIVYVTGYCDGSPTNYSGTNYDFATIAYDLNGNQLWIARYNGPANADDFARAMTIDSFGNILVTGSSEGNNGKADFLTIAYNINGNELWTARYDATDDGDWANAITTDSFGNVYVTGHSYIGDYSDYATIAYDPSGNELWTIRYDGPTGSSDYPYGIALDSSGNIYVTGKSYVTGGVTSTEELYDFATIKYSQEKPIPQPTIDIDPNTLNLKSKGRWISCYITLNNPYNVNYIDISTILLEYTIPAEWGDIQGDTLMVKSDRSDVEDMLSPGTYNLKVTGKLKDGTEFEGYSDEIRVIDPP